MEDYTYQKYYLKINIFYYQKYSSSIQKIKKRIINELEKPLQKLKT